MYEAYNPAARRSRVLLLAPGRRARGSNRKGSERRGRGGERRERGDEDEWGLPLAVLRALLLRFGLTVRDARGRKVRLYHPTVFDYVDGTTGSFPQRDVNRVISILEKRSVSDVQASRQFTVGLAVFAVLLTAAAAALFIWEGGPAKWIVLGAALVLGLTLVQLLGAYRCGATPMDHRIPKAEEMQRAMLMADRCPSCTHDIAGVSPEFDGRTVCPECGAAWKVELASE